MQILLFIVNVVGVRSTWTRGKWFGIVLHQANCWQRLWNYWNNSCTLQQQWPPRLWS